MFVFSIVLVVVMVISIAVSLHLGPHLGVGSGIISLVISAIAIIFATTRSGPIDTTLLIIYLLALAISIAVIVFGARSIIAETKVPRSRATTSPIGHIGRALSDIDPEGRVKVNGEEWSARSVDSPIPIGSEVFVVDADKIHLTVTARTSDPFSINVQND